MQSRWLTQNNKKSCILFLAGWGMDSTPFGSIPVHNHDVLMAYNYCQVKPLDIMQELDRYASLHLVAWSMGVWVAAGSFAAFRNRFRSATAINGTLCPIDDQLGIPQKPFNDMIEHFSQDVLENFYRDMFDRPEEAETFLDHRPARQLESIVQELRTLKTAYADQGPGEDIFSRKIVGTRDRIFPARAQLRCWGKENCLRIKKGHFPFYDLPSWDTIIEGGIQE